MIFIILDSCNEIYVISESEYCMTIVTVIIELAVFVNKLLRTYCYVLHTRGVFCK